MPLLLELFTMFSYMNDGFAYAAEALTGRFIGARDEGSLRRCCLKGCIAWGTAVSAAFVVIYIIWWRDLVGLFISSTATNAAALIERPDNTSSGSSSSRSPRPCPSSWTASWSEPPRHASCATRCSWPRRPTSGIYYALHPVIGNNALWLAFTLYMFLRGVLQYFMTGRLRAIHEKART